MSCKNFLFKEENNTLKYTGTEKDFDNIYKCIKDPWGQSNTQDNYYINSRNKIQNILTNITKNINKKIYILEIGCGNGFSTSKLNIDSKYIISGCDISEKAINLAKNNFPELTFFTHNIKNPLDNSKKYDFILISNLLWYILDDLKICFDNCFNNLKDNGKLIFFNAFLKDQKYGKEIIDGFDGMKKFILKNYPENKIELEINDLDKYEEDHRYFGLFVINK